jgi:hypothetical protein
MMDKVIESECLSNNKMIDRIVNQKNAYFVSQQKDEMDLTLDQKRLIVEQLFNNNLEVFLQRYGTYLLEEDFKYFDKFSDNYVINCHLINLRKILDKNKRKIIIKNRRFEALQRLDSNGDYFSDHEMQTRNPFLFEQMVGQYMTDKEKRELTRIKYEKNYDKITFSSFLIEQIEKSEVEKRFQMQEEFEDNARQESDSDESECTETSDIKTDTTIDSNERQRLREEFKKIMFEQFLSGNDSQFFDYNQVDYSDQYDSNQIEDRDEEEKYFDAEDSNE